MNIPENLKYTKDHEWARKEGAYVVVGELPAVGSKVKAGAAFGTVESVKAVSDLFAPISGDVAEVNAELANTPDAVNKDPYGDAWMIKVKPANPAELDKLLSPADYRKLCESEG